MRKVTAILITLTFILCLAPMSYALDFDRVVDTGYSKSVPIPISYQYTKSIYYLGDKYRTLSEPQDLFIDSKNQLYIADTKNNRILKLDLDGKLLKAYTSADGKDFKEPQGIFVTSTGELYIADTGNQRIVALNADGGLIRVFNSPRSEMLGKDFVFNPSKVAVTSTGNLYVLKQQWLMSISKDGEFRGFVGVTKVKPDFFGAIRKIFLNQAQRKVEQRVTPPSCLSFELTRQDEIFVTTMDFDRGQFKKLNLLGDDIFPKKSLFGEMLPNDLNIMTPQTFIDVSTDADGNIFLLDQQFARVTVYDQQGNNLAIFSGSSYGKGKLSIPSAIAIDPDGMIYIADQKLNEIMIYKPTKFMKTVSRAANYFSSGDYEKSVEEWNAVLKTDENYSLANNAIAKAYYKSDNWEKSMEFYKLSNDKAGYSSAFSNYRHDVYKKNFFVVVLCIFTVFGLLVFIMLKFKKYSMHMLDNF